MGTPISSLPLASTPTGTEYVPIVQSGTTKRTTVSEVAQTLLPITTDKISDANVTADKLAINSVTTVKIVDANVTAEKLASGAAVSNIGTAGITATQLASNSITTAKIVDANITAAKLSGAQSGSAPIFGARAWVNFDGTRDSTGALSTANTNRLIRASGNVASVLRNATGNYTLNFTSPLADANYAVHGTGSGGAGTGAQGVVVLAEALATTDSYSTKTTSAVQIVATDNNTDSLTDAFSANVTIFR